MRFNHMELTFGRGGLDEDTRADINRFYGDIFNWRCAPYELFGQLGHIMLPPDGDQFILLMEVDDPIHSPSYDHLGLLLDSRQEVDDVLEHCRRFQEKDDRVQIKEFDDIVLPEITQRAFYVRYILPIWFDVHSQEYPPGTSRGHWQYVEA